MDTPLKYFNCGALFSPIVIFWFGLFVFNLMPCFVHQPPRGRNLIFRRHYSYNRRIQLAQLLQFDWSVLTAWAWLGVNVFVARSVYVTAPRTLQCDFLTLICFRII